MKFYVEGTVFERIEENKVVYVDGKRTEETKLEKCVGFMVKKEGKKSELVYVKLDESENIANFKSGVKIVIPVVANPWIENGKKAKLSLKQDGKITGVKE